MKPEYGGVLLGCLILLLLMVPVGLRAFGRDTRRERWGRYEYRITRSGSFVFEGSSMRCEVPEELDGVARYVLTEWFNSPEGERALVRDSHLERYHCVVFLAGYGAGEAWGER